MQIGNHFIIHKDSELGWTIFDSGWNKWRLKNLIYMNLKK
jgi:hypothetical protein